MNYILLSLVALAGYIALYIVQKRNPITRIVGIANGICGSIGILLYPAVVLLLRFFLRGETDANFVSWAWDALTLYLRFALIVTGTLLCLTVTAGVSALSVKTHRKNRLHLLVSLFASAALLLTGPFYAFIIETDRIPLSALILTLSFASALSMRWHAFAEWMIHRHIVKKGKEHRADDTHDL